MPNNTCSANPVVRRRPGHGRFVKLALAVVGLVLALHAPRASAQTIAFAAGSPALTNTYDWKLTKRLAGGGAGGTTLSVPRGSNIDLAYTIVVERSLAATAATATFTVTCPAGWGGATVVVTNQATGATVANGATPATGSPSVTFTGLTLAPSTSSGSTGSSSGALVARCTDSAGRDAISSPAELQFTTATTVEVRGSATLSDVITWPTWSQFFPSGNWLTTTPTTAVTSGNYPSSGTTLRDSTTFTYVMTISNTMLCISGASVSNTATLVAGSGVDAKTYSDTASATIAVTQCDVSPEFSVSTPNVQTALTYAWSQQITPLASTGLQVAWGGGASLPAQAAFTRTVTAAVLSVSFDMTITNPSKGPIALTNVQLSCPWGGNTLLPCGAVSAGGSGGFGGGTLLVIPGSGTSTCRVNNLQLQGSWGADFTQPCTIMTSTVFGTQSTFTGLTLNFYAPTRSISINNCALWSMTCMTSAGNAFWAPTVGGMPVSQQVCGSDTSNAPLPPQPFSISLGGGWVGDGTQPGACASSVTVSCQSSLQLQSTAGTTQGYGGTQTSSLSLTATPINCPPPATPLPVIQQQNTLIGGIGGVGGTLMSADPVLTPTITRTTIRGAFAWAVTSSISPASQPIAQGSAGVAGRYTVTATPQAASAAEAVQYLLEGSVRVTNPSTFASMAVQEVLAVFDGSGSVPLACNPGLPYALPPGASLSCSLLVNYAAGTSSVLYTRAVVVSEVGVRRTVDGAAARFTWDGADVSQARGACARVSQAFATNAFDLMHTAGIAPAFDATAATTVCSATTWTFDVAFLPREGAPCGPQQVIETVVAVWDGGAGQLGQAQGTSIATLTVTGLGCPAPPSSSTTTTTSSAGTSIIEEGGPAPTVATPVAAPAATSTSQDAQQAAAAPAATGLAVELGGVQASAASEPAWQLSMEPEAANVTLKAGAAASVGFTVSWSRMKAATDYSGSVSITNNRAEPVELDGVVVDLLSATGDVAATSNAECPNGSVVQAVSSSHTLKLPPGAKVTCAFKVQATVSGSLAATVTTAGGGDATVSKAAAAVSLMAANSGCAKLLTGMAASELGQRGVLTGSNGTTQQEVCTPGSQVVRINIPDNAPATKCTYPVVAIAWLRPSEDLVQQGAVASARADVVVSGCSAAAPAATASVAAPSLTKGRYMRWEVEMTADPDVSNDTFEGESLEVLAKWQQTLEPSQHLNATGDVLVRGAPDINKAQVVLIPLCPPDEAGADCAPVLQEAPCKSAADNPEAARCHFVFVRQHFVPGLLLPTVEGGQAAAAAAYDPSRAAFGGKPPVLCARLSEQHTVKPLDGGGELKMTTSGAAELSAEPFCGLQKLSNFTLLFEDVECGKHYVFHSRAVATPVLAGSEPVAAELTFNVTC